MLYILLKILGQKDSTELKEFVWMQLTLVQ